MEYTKIQLRTDTQANWNTHNPVLARGEVGIVSDVNKFKIGDGMTAFVLLPFATMSLEELEQIKNNADIAMSGMEVIDTICKKDGYDSTLEIEPNKIYSLVGEDSLFTNDFDLKFKTKENSTFKGTSYIIFKKIDVPHLKDLFIPYNSNFIKLNSFDREKNYHIIQIIGNGTFGFINSDFIMPKLKTINGESLETRYNEDININGIKYEDLYLKLQNHDYSTPLIIDSTNNENYFCLNERSWKAEVHDNLIIQYSNSNNLKNIHFFYWDSTDTLQYYYRVRNIEFQDESGNVFTKRGNVVYDESDPNQVHFAIVLPSQKAVFFLDDMGSGSGVTMEEVENLITSKGYQTSEEVENAIISKNYVPKENFASINQYSITDGGNIDIPNGVIWNNSPNVTYNDNIYLNILSENEGVILDCRSGDIDSIVTNDLTLNLNRDGIKHAKVLFRFDSNKYDKAHIILYNLIYGCEEDERITFKKNVWYLIDLDDSQTIGLDGVAYVTNLSNIPTKLSELLNDTNYVPKENFATINNQSITDGGNIDIQGGGGGVTMEEVESAITSKGYQTNADVEDMIISKNYVPIDSFATINNQSITDGGNIEVKSGTEINIDNALGMSTNPVENKAVSNEVLEIKNNMQNIDSKISNEEEWVFTMDDGSVVKKKIIIPILNYFYVEDINGMPNSVSMYRGDTEVSLEYSTDTQVWNSWSNPYDDAISIPSKGKLYMRGTNNTLNNLKFKTDTTINVGGDITTLLTPEGNVLDLTGRDNCFFNLFSQAPIVNANKLILPSTTLSPYCYQSLFQDNATLVTAPMLPATTLCEGCYTNMFNGCSSLTQAPMLPATRVLTSSYLNMFRGCSSLTQAPILPAMELSTYCYESMFQDCSSLTQAPMLPATRLDYGCYKGMFSGCSSLTQAPMLPAMELTDYCYSHMFENCSKIKEVSELPATTLAPYCYEYMFYGCYGIPNTPLLPAMALAERCYSHMFDSCLGLSVVTELPATMLAQYCYEYMFNNCYGLDSISKLPAMALTIGCYNGMFSQCTSLVNAPELPAMTLVQECYDTMFYGCTNLVSITINFTSWTENTTSNWLLSVAPSGTITKPADLINLPIDDASGVPTGWTTIDK